MADPTLIATAGDEDANSYLSIADADALAADDIGSESVAWLAATAATKESVLKRATREIDGYVATGWPPFSADQALLFPRETDTDAADAPLIPRKIELATYQQAIYVLKHHAELSAMNAHRSRGGTVDPDASYSIDPSNGPSIISPMAEHYLADFRKAPHSGKAGNLGSVRVSSGFLGGY